MCNVKRYENVFSRDQEDIRTARGDEEVALYNAKKRRIIYSSCRVGCSFCHQYKKCLHDDDNLNFSARGYFSTNPCTVVESILSVPLYPRMIQMMSLPLQNEHTAAVTLWISLTSRVKRERRLQAQRDTQRFHVSHSLLTWGLSFFWGDGILSNLLFWFCSGQWLGWEWAGVIQWRGGMEKWQLKV